MRCENYNSVSIFVLVCKIVSEWYWWCFSGFTELGFLQTRSRRKCVCVLIVSNPKRGALLLHVWRISITKRLRICVWVRDTGRREQEVVLVRWVLNVLYWSSSNVVWPFTFHKANSDHIPATPDDLFKGCLVFYSISPLSAIIIQYYNPWNFTFPTHSITACSFHCPSALHPLKHTPTLTDTTFTSLPVPLPWVDRNERIIMERVCRCH